ncbi:hypothetical protein [Formosa sp. PL04]|uniref:hypothetical protein n=1 Tax=Formosa sp. PL04 TaxID=3081755 RepID=UPI0029823BE7|nr:hypothetical protein [Formosa sp. PL04]MDW5290822.1 hypothetical protein [Formosa sp. PL04]
MDKIVDYADIIQAPDPGCSLRLNQGNQIYKDDNNDRIWIASDGISDTDLTAYPVIKNKTSTGQNDFISSHVTSHSLGAPSNSWGYEELTITEMVENPWAPLGNKQGLDHSWLAINPLCHIPTQPLVFDLEQAYRFVRRIIDAGTAITFANTTDYRSPNASEMKIGYSLPHQIFPKPCEKYYKQRGGCIGGS